MGKTTVSSILSQTLAAEGKRILAIDADPNGNLSLALGYDAIKDGRITPLIERKDVIKERTGTEPGQFGGTFVMNPKVDDFVDRFAVDINGLKLMVTGELKEALTGCYCPENALLRSFMSHLFMERDEWVILDMEAGFEHLTRGTAESVNVMLVVVEPGQRAVQTAAKIAKLAEQLGIQKIGYVLNKIHDESHSLALSGMLDAEKIMGKIPYDIKAVEADLAGATPFEKCPVLSKSIKQIRMKLEKFVKDL